MNGWLEHLLQPSAAAAPPTIVVLTEAFMEMEAALSQTQTAVENYRSVYDQALDQHWAIARAACDDATATYLTLTAAESAPRLTQAWISRGIELLRAATGQVEMFRSHCGQCLSAATSAIAGITAAVWQAQDAAEKAQALHRGLDTASGSCPSVRVAADQLDQACAQLVAARNYREMAAVAGRVNAAAGFLDAAVRAAPRLAADAKHALGSISTRICAARTRLDDGRPAMSALLREFPAASSADLVHNEAGAREHIATAVDCLARARAVQHRGDPEEALALAVASRVALNEADRLINAVPQRLQALRDMRADPKKRSERARFALRDAQMFAVGQGITERWAPVLDAQAKRIEALEAQLDTRHPDYWGYATGLDNVQQFIADTVTRMRDTVRR